jgi:RND family efflux transporter MFP subunit
MKKSFFRRHKAILIFLFVVLIVGGSMAYYLRPKPIAHEFATVERRDIKQEVSVTGRVKPAEEVSLAFEKSGKVSRVYSKVGVRVERGALLAKLEDSDILAKIDEAKARLSAESFKLNSLQQGTRIEEVNVQKTRVANAKVTFDNAKSALTVAMNDAHTKADDAIRNKTDKFFMNPRTPDAKLSFFIADSGLQNAIELSRWDIERMFALWETNTLVVVKQNMTQIKSFLDKLALALSNAGPNGSVTQSMLDGYKADVSIARGNINLAISALDSAEQIFRVAESSVTLEESNLTLKEAPTLPDTILAQKAVIAQAEASIRSFEAEASKFLLRSPISGTVVKEDVRQGETVSLNVPLISIISQSKLEIEAFIPEADIAKVRIGDHASATLDAYGDTVIFPIAVISIDPTETLIEGVATYKTVFQFSEDDNRIKPGMTANVDILTDKKDRVLVLPQRLLTRKENAVFAKILDGVEVRDVFVQTGLRGSDGYVEIVSGLGEGDRVIVPKN